MKTRTIQTATRMVAIITTIIATSVTGAQAQLAQATGIAKFTLPANSTEVFGMPFVRPVVTSGKITSYTPSADVPAKSTSTSTFEVTLNAGEPSIPALNNTSTAADERYILEITDGPALGFICPCTGSTVNTSTGNTVVTVEGTTDTVPVPANSSFVIRKDNTLSSVFGAPSANHPFGYGVGPTEASVKAYIQVYNSVTGTLTSYYVYNSGTTWQYRATSGPTDRTHVRLAAGKAVILASRVGTDIAVAFNGESRSARTRLWVPEDKITFLANPAPLASTFEDANIPDTTPKRGVGAAGVMVVGNASNADEWKVWNPATRTFANYYVGTDVKNFPTFLRPNGTTQNPVLNAFGGVGVKPLTTGKGYTVVTLAPKL